MGTEEKPKRQPPHQTVVGLISRVLDPEASENVGRFIMETEFSEGYDEIIAAWEGNRFSLGLAVNDDVVADLRKQKAEAEKKAAKKAKAEAEREDSKAAVIGRYLLASVELTDRDIDRIWNALPGQARVELQAEVLTRLAAQRARV